MENVYVVMDIICKDNIVYHVIMVKGNMINNAKLLIVKMVSGLLMRNVMMETK